MASPEKVRFRAVPGILAPVPGQAARHGGQVEYVGRRTDADAVKANSKVRTGERHAVLKDLEACHPCDADSNAVYTNDEPGYLSALRRMARDGDIAPADDVTAKWCGLAFDTPASTAAPAARVPRRTAETTKPEASS